MKNETMMIAFCNQKGGVGKSTMTILLASYLHYTRGLNVAVVDCDDPQHSLANMRERDKKAVLKSDYFKRLMMEQFERIGRKAYPIINSVPEQAREAIDSFLEEAEDHYDLIIVDLPGTVKSQGVFRTVVNMDYVITPIIADRMVMQSSLAFSTAVLDFIKGKPEVPLKDIIFFWTKMKKSAASDVFDLYCKILERLELTVMKTVVPDTVRYDKELPLRGNAWFRCTLLPPPAKLLKGSGFEEFATELCEMLNLGGHE
jgi:cellulose biosynthesis protein BcsQ